MQFKTNTFFQFLDEFLFLQQQEFLRVLHEQ